MTSKQRSNLRSLANALEPSATIGKGGMTDNVAKQISDALEAHELVKVQVLSNADFTARDAADDIAKSTRSEVVQVMGSKITLYRKSHRNGVIHLIF